MAENDLTWEGYIHHLWRKKNEGNSRREVKYKKKKIKNKKKSYRYILLSNSSPYVLPCRSERSS
jgi:hypothetical protein